MAQRGDFAIEIHESQLTLRKPRKRQSRKVDEGARIGEAELRGAGGGAGIAHTFDQLNRSSGHLQTSRIEFNRHYFPGVRVYEVPGGCITRVASAFDQRFALTGLQRLRDNSRAVPHEGRIETAEKARYQ